MTLKEKARVGLLRGTFLAGSALFALAATAEAQTAEDAPAASAGDIIVTARRSEERLQDVPISISVFNQEDLTKRNVAVATDLATYTPSLSVNQRYGPEKASFAIRGFNQTNNTAPTVGMYFAEVVGVRAQGGTTSGNTVGAGAFSDLANVQVLKGPQGTLFGRNTTGGAILLTPQKPTDKFEGFAEGTYGNYDQVRLTGALNVPLADTFKVRLTVERNSRDGYMKNHAPVGARDFNDVNYFYGRLSVVADLTPNLENYMIAHYSRSRTHGYASRINNCNVGGTGTTLLQSLSCQDQLTRQTARGDGPYDVENSLVNPFEHLEQWQIINTTTWQASDTITLKNIASYGEFRERMNLAYLSTNFTTPNQNNSGGFTLFGNFIPAGQPYILFATNGAGKGSYAAAESTVTEELQLQGKSADGRINYVLGGYLEFSRPIGFSNTISPNFLNCVDGENFNCTNPLGFGNFSEARTKMAFDNHGIYGQGTYKFSDQLSLTAGARWTFDKIVGTGQGTRISFSTAPGSYIDPRTGMSIRRTCTDTVTYPGKVVQASSQCSTHRENKSDKPTWVIDLDFKPIPDLLLYGKYARGYRQGGINFNSVGFETWGPESMDSYEGGAKFSFNGGIKGYFNVAGFYNKLSDVQVLAQLIPTAASQQAGISGASAILNAGKARSYGVEVDTSLLFFDRLRLSASYAYLNTKIVKIDSPSELAAQLVGTPFGSVNPQVAQGTGFLDTPKHKLSVDANYTLPLDESLGSLSVGATWTYTSTVVTNYSDPRYVSGYPVGITPSNNLVNLNLDWKEVAGTPINLSLFVTNLTKEVIKIPNQFPYAFSGGAVHSGYLPPRMYGLRLRYNFGG
ncbi:TonB-dependent receptor [Sphingobium estronivorans]|uniref:TonB-dependent receptor n=1 Tax=Sphingobium estronivorans TaxID=1577690 RepID=UPI0013C34B2C|nr:TonB-dependent receptor [Sphingobium estronivorans]